MYQITISQWGLSLGEIETINNLFGSYQVTEIPIENNTNYSSIFEIEFIKNADIDFYESLPIEKWTHFIDLIKNIKKRRGRKGLKFKVMITEYFELDNNISQDGQNFNNGSSYDNKKDSFEEYKKDKTEVEEKEEEIIEVPLQFFRRIIFLLGHRNDSDFNKGLERIEITIENLTELQKKIFKAKEIEDMSGLVNRSIIENNGQGVKGGHFYDHMYQKKEEIADLSIFVFDEKKRTWNNI